MFDEKRLMGSVADPWLIHWMGERGWGMSGRQAEKDGGKYFVV